MNPAKMFRNIFLFTLALEFLTRYRYVFKKEKESFRGKVVVITGGTRGLGFIVASKFISEEAKVVIIARDQDELTSVEEQFKKSGASILTQKCDVSDNRQVQRVVANILKVFGGIDVLVNNAGIIQVGPLENMQRDDFVKAMSVNVWGAINMTLAILPHMEQKKEGHIVNITSLGGVIAVPHLLPYAISKFAMAGFSEGLQAELYKKGIKVTTVIPGLMRTGSSVHGEYKGKYRQEFKWFSFLDSFPPVSMDAQKAASRIIKSVRNSDPVLILTVPAKVAILFKACFPFLMVKMLSLTNLFLPEPNKQANES